MRTLVLLASLLCAAPAFAQGANVSVANPARGTVLVTAAGPWKTALIVVTVDDVGIGSCLARSCQVAWDTTDTTNGFHVIRASFYDQAGRLRWADKQSTTVANPPDVTLVTLQATPTELSFAFDVKTPGDQLSRVQVFWDQMPMSEGILASGQVHWDLAGESPGEHVLRVVATDSHGNVGEAAVKVTVP